MNNLSLEHAQRYCVFQSSDNWYGIPCLEIRSVIPRPAVTRLPFCDPVLNGVSHIQNEFLPVASLRSLLDLQYEAVDSENQLLIISGRQCPWGLLVDRTNGLADLETSYTALPHQDDASWSKAVVGSATHAKNVIKVLDTDVLFSYALKLLNSFWSDSTRLEKTTESQTVTL